jgi:hypothetical protein
MVKAATAAAAAASPPGSAPMRLSFLPPARTEPEPSAAAEEALLPTAEPPATPPPEPPAAAPAPGDLFDVVAGQPKYPWPKLSPAMQTAASELGYDAAEWPAHRNDSAGGSWPHWDELSQAQRDAAGVLGIKARDWHSEKLWVDIEVIFTQKGRLGVGFEKGVTPLCVSSVAGHAEREGVSVGMVLRKVSGEDAQGGMAFDDVVALLASHAVLRPLALVFSSVS